MEIDSQVITMNEPTVQSGLLFELPWYVVVPVQIAAFAWEFGVVSMITLPWWSIIAAFASIDWLLDWVFLFTIGLVCNFCAGIFIWVINIAMIPLLIAAWVQRAFLETFGLIIDGWMLVFNWSGCYLNIGKHCWFTPAPWNRSMRTAFDLPFMIAGGDSLWDSLVTIMTPPDIKDKTQFLAVRAAHRSNLWAAIPGVGPANAIYEALSEHFDF